MKSDGRHSLTITPSFSSLQDSIAYCFKLVTDRRQTDCYTAWLQGDFYWGDFFRGDFYRVIFSVFLGWFFPGWFLPGWFFPGWFFPGMFFPIFTEFGSILPWPISIGYWYFWPNIWAISTSIFFTAALFGELIYFIIASKIVNDVFIFILWGGTCSLRMPTLAQCVTPGKGLVQCCATPSG